MKAREFLAHKKQPLVERHVLKEPPTEAELRDFARRAGGMHSLIAPKRKAELEGLSEAALLRHFLENPGHLRRPIIDTGKKLVLGFSKDAREALGE